MNRLLLAFVLLSLFLTQACSKILKGKSKAIVYKKTLIHPLFFQNEIANNLTFAFWFDDQLIRKNKIQEIRFKYLENLNELDETQALFPKRTVSYIFNKKGKVIHVQVTTYSEGIVISTVSYWLKSKAKSAYSYAKLEKNILTNYNPKEHREILDPLKISKKLFVFKNRNTKSKIFYVLDSAMHSPLKISRDLKPSASDFVVWGRPSRPIKRYQVYNTVKEKNVVLYSYNTENFPKKIIRDNFPFTYQRNFVYSNGNFSGFLDSTFIDGTFVTSERTRIISNKNKLPTLVSRKKEHSESEKATQFNIAIEYEYWK